ncbi:MAG: hypothetical protein HY007_03205 [Candidatus Sungbacteria bacterium]|nr:hypothetical protein [Candidatus Sungbacteria bacterium]
MNKSCSLWGSSDEAKGDQDLIQKECLFPQMPSSYADRVFFAIKRIDVRRYFEAYILGWDIRKFCGKNFVYVFQNKCNAVMMLGFVTVTPKSYFLTPIEI